MLKKLDTLNIPHILKIYGCAYQILHDTIIALIIMNKIDGITFHDYLEILRNTDIECCSILDNALKLGKELRETVLMLHINGIMHSDLNDQNIMIMADRDTLDFVIIDFGNATECYPSPIDNTDLLMIGFHIFNLLSTVVHKIAPLSSPPPFNITANNTN